MENFITETLLTNVTFGGLFVVLFWWVLKQNEKREANYHTFMERMTQELKDIAVKLGEISAEIRIMRGGRNGNDTGTFK